MYGYVACFDVFQNRYRFATLYNMIVFSTILTILNPAALGFDGNFGMDLGMANNNRVHVDSLASIRTMPSTISLIPRYTISGAAYLYPSLDYGLSAAALDSSNGTIALGVIYQRESIQQGLDYSFLPGWKLPEEEIEQISLQSLTGGSLAISFLNRSLSLGTGLFYLGTSNDLEVYTHAIEFNLSAGAKFSDQVILGISAVDVLDQTDGSRMEMGVRWGVLDVSGPVWQRCMGQSDIYYSSGGLEMDMGYSLRNGGMDFIGVGGDFPITCFLSLHGGVQKRFIQEEMRYGMGFFIENVSNAIGYDVQLRTHDHQEWEHIHLLSMKFRLSNAPFAPKPKL